LAEVVLALLILDLTAEILFLVQLHQPAAVVAPLTILLVTPLQVEAEVAEDLVAVEQAQDLDLVQQDRVTEGAEAIYKVQHLPDITLVVVAALPLKGKMVATKVAEEVGPDLIHQLLDLLLVGPVADLVAGDLVIACGLQLVLAAALAGLHLVFLARLAQQILVAAAVADRKQLVRLVVQAS
jgi:hypothetical protein